MSRIPYCENEYKLLKGDKQKQNSEDSLMGETTEKIPDSGDQGIGIFCCFTHQNILPICFLLCLLGLFSRVYIPFLPLL